jgi:hypothetical protein
MNGCRMLNSACLRVMLGEAPGGWHVREIAARTADGWRTILEGVPGSEFSVMPETVGATMCNAAGGTEAQLRVATDNWAATGTIILDPGRPVLRRRQVYRFTRGCRGAIAPGFRLKSDSALRYTFPLRAWNQPLSGLGPMRSAVDWALPLPFHVWHVGGMLVLYGVDRTVSAGTLDFMPPDEHGYARLGVYFPDTAAQPQSMTAPGFSTPAIPGTVEFAAGQEVALTELVAVKLLQAGEDPLLEAERLAADLLLHGPRHAPDLPRVAGRIREFYGRCELWEPDAFGPGCGWFTNMWVRTQTGPACKRGEMSGYFDFGWGEGIAVEMMQGAVRHWKRTGNTSLLHYVDTMSQSIERFKRAPGDDQPYFDRSDGKRFGDFLMDHTPGNRIWTHSLGHNGNQLLELWQFAPDYPDATVRRKWLNAAGSMARFLARRQNDGGDLQDIFDDQDREVNAKPHRITARASVCGLWTRMAQVTGDDTWLARARRLAAAVAPEIGRYEFYNQMLDGIAAPSAEFTDGEAAYYVLEGLVPLYGATRDPAVLALCRRAAAYGIAWTYFYDVPRAHNGVARGGQCCRMDDFPLLYPIGTAKGMGPLLELYALTGDPLFERFAAEGAAFIGSWQMDAPGQPWDGGMIHALGQYCGKHWGPDLAGQVDSGMATGNSLAAIERWLSRHGNGAGKNGAGKGAENGLA